VYRKWEARLAVLYRSRIDFKDVGTHNWWNLEDWSWVLDGHKMFDDDSFTREEGNLCYYFAKFTVFDYMKDAAKYSALDWLSFLEALGHVVRFKVSHKQKEIPILLLECLLLDLVISLSCVALHACAPSRPLFDDFEPCKCIYVCIYPNFQELPRVADLLSFGVSDCGALKSQLDASGLTWNAHMAEHPLSSSKDDPFEVRLDQFLYLLFYEVDARTAVAKSKMLVAVAGAPGGSKTGKPGSNKPGSQGK
jgi:hypothetical protein